MNPWPHEEPPASSGLYQFLPSPGPADGWEQRMAARAAKRARLASRREEELRAWQYAHEMRDAMQRSWTVLAQGPPGGCRQCYRASFGSWPWQGWFWYHVHPAVVPHVPPIADPLSDSAADWCAHACHGSEVVFCGLIAYGAAL